MSYSEIGPASSFGKTSSGSSRARTRLSDISFARLSERTTPSERTEDGRFEVWLPDPASGSLGGFSTVDISESRFGAVASSLSQILESEPIPPGFYLRVSTAEAHLTRSGSDLDPTLEASLRAILSPSTSEDVPEAPALRDLIEP